MQFINTTIDRLFRKLVEEKEDAKSLFYEEESFSWKEMNQIAEKMAVDIINLDIKKGSRIAIWCQNSPLYLCAFLAIVKAGCTAVLMNPSYTTYEMNQLIDYADMKGIYCDDDCMKRVQKISKMDFLNYIGMDALERLQAREELHGMEREKLYNREAETDPHDLACMLFTSGTTGGAKGVELTHYQLLNVALRAVEAMRWNADDRVCVSLPLFHSFGLSMGFLAALFHGGVICLNSSYKSLAVMRCVEKYQCTVLNGVPTMFLSLLYNSERKNHDLSSLHSGIIAGSSVYEEDFLNIAKEIPIPHLMQSYGQTEASPSITFSPYEDSLEKRAKSTGKVIPDVEIRIRSLQKEENMPPGLSGEVEIRGFNTMHGYFNRKADTARILQKDGWMKTGDIGYLDEEGYLYILGRKQEMIIRGGENISPQEIEEVLLSLDGVKQVKVFGVKEAVIQENIAACIVTDWLYTEEQVKAYAAKYLVHYKIPKYIYFFQKFPEGANGKIDVKALKKIAEDKIHNLKQ